MSTLGKSRIALLATVLFLPEIGFSQAQTSDQASAANAPMSVLYGDVTLGAGEVTQSSAVYGRYNGMPKAGVGVLGSFQLRDAEPWDSGGTRYLNTSGDNLNFGWGEIGPEASVNVETGDQGSWRISATYDAITYTASDNFTTILDREGNLSPGYQNALIGGNMYFTNVPANPSTLFGAFNASTHLATANPITNFGSSNELTLDIGTRRDKGTLDGSVELGDWTLSTVVSHEHKHGSLEQTMTTGGNNAGMVAFPMPVDYDTDIFTAAAAYDIEDFQVKLSYQFSNFIDHNSGGYTFEGWNFSAYFNPTTKTYTSYPKSGDYSLPPGNQAHAITAEAGYNIDPTTRVTGTAVYGLQLQNSPFVPATNLGYIFSPPGASLAAQLATNPTSLNGLVQTFFGNLLLTARPIPKLDIKANYSIDTRNPQTSSMLIYGDPTDTTALKFRQAVPESWTKQQFSLKAGYYVLDDTRLNVGYTYRNDHRGNAITHDTEDNEVSADIHSTFSSNFTGTLGYIHADRTASAPDFSLWLVQIPADCGSTLAALGCQQIPFYEAARTQDTVNGLLTGMINSQTSLSLIGKYDANEYHSQPAVYNGTVNPSVGVNRDYRIQAGPDLNYQITENEEVHFFYTFLRYYRDMRALNNQSVPGGGNFYSVASTYDIHTAGISGNWQASDKLKLVGDYTFSYAGEGFVQTGTWDLGFPGDPRLSTKSVNNQVRMHADYEYSKDTSFYLGYEFDSLDTSDWAMVGASVGQVLTGDVPAKYNVSKIIAAMTVRL